MVVVVVAVTPVRATTLAAVMYGDGRRRCAIESSRAVLTASDAEASAA